MKHDPEETFLTQNLDEPGRIFAAELGNLALSVEQLAKRWN